MHTDHLGILKKVKKLSRLLNIKPHDVGDQANPKTIYTPIDLGPVVVITRLYTLILASEGHYGLDNRLYLLDFSRVFPPCTPPVGMRSAYLYRLLRGEFVRRWPKPLCSDAFSNFTKGLPSAEADNEEVRQATEHLRTRSIAEFAAMLLSLPTSMIANFPFIQSLHTHGINVRYLGLLRQHLVTGNSDSAAAKYWVGRVLVEMLSRTLKQLLRKKLRARMHQLRQSGEAPYKVRITTASKLL